MPRLTQSEIHSDFSSASETWSEYRAQVIAFYDNYPHSELNDHITREFNKKIRDLSQSESLYISPYNAGLRYIGDGVFTVDPLSFNPYFYIDAASSMLGVLESPSLDLNPAVPSTLDIITATRAGTATYTDASGNIQTASPNTVRVDHVQGEELTPTKFQRVKYTDFSSGWGSASSQAGDGYLGNASRVVSFNGFGTYIHRVTTDNTKTYKASIYLRVKSGDSGLIRLFHQLQSGSGNSNSIIAATTEWQRFDITLSSTGTFVNFGVAIFSSGTVEVEIAMPQFEEGATVSDFVANTTGSPKYFAAATYAPRVPMILVEPAATNLVDYSDLNPAGAWSSTGFNVTQNAILSPDGLNNGTKLEQTSTTRNINGAFISSSTGTSVTYSFWIKKGSGDTHLNSFLIRNNSRSPYNMKGSINLETGEIIVNEFGAGNLIVESYPNGWFKVKATRDTDISVGDVIYIYPPYTSSDGSNEIGQYNYTFGYQAEYGTVATSYIPTSGSAVTRAADNLVIDGSDFTNFYNQSEGTIYVEYEPRVLGTTNTALEFSDGTADDRIFSLVTFSYHCYIQDGGVTQAVLDGGTVTAGVLNRLAFSYEANNIQASLEGGSVVSDTSASIPTVDRLILGNQTVANTRYLNGMIKRLIYWPHHSDNI
jgi:hypothetical protein